MKDIQLRKVINKINNDININNDEDDLLIKEKGDYEDLFIEGKANTFKIYIAKIFIFLDRHYTLNSFLKLIFGIIFLFLPLLLIIILTLLDFSERNNYIFFPSFFSLNIIMWSLLILLVVKIGEACQISGFLIYTWERKNIFKIINSIFNCIFILWFLFLMENFVKSLSLLKEKVAQTNTDTPSQSFDKGTYTERILFILNFWDLEKDNNGEYIHKTLEYFEYEDSVFDEFHDHLKMIFIPIVLFEICNLIKIIFIKNQRIQILNFILYFSIIFISFFLMFYLKDDSDELNSIKKEKKEEKEDENYKYIENIDCKYVELIAYILIILLLLIKSFIMHLKLIKKKYISQKKELNKLATIISILSFLICLSGYSILTCDIIFLAFDKIDQNLTIKKYENYWNLFWISLCLIFSGYSFIFGHYFFNLIYYPVAYEISPHNLKNKFYIRCSGTIIETKENMNMKYRYSLSQKQFDSLYHKII